MKLLLSKYLAHPLFIALVFSLVIHAINVFQYDIFSEKDSYGWVLQYEQAFATHTLDLYRPFFASFVYTLHALTGLTVGQIFKYLLPFFSVLVIFPLWVMARSLRTPQWQTLFLCCSLVSPTVIFQMESMRPQIMVVYFLYFLLGMTYFFRFQTGVLFDLIVGGLLLLGIFFHSGFGVFFLLWAVSMIYRHWRWCWQRKQQTLLWIVISLVGVFSLFRFAQMSGYLSFIPELVKNLVLNFLALDMNFSYPATYVNSDGVTMGWPGWEGVAKFYGFYVGPLILTGIVGILAVLYRHTSARYFFLELFREKRFLFIFLCIGALFSVAEILPRFFNIALLPDRTWTFLAIFLLFPLFFLITYIEKEEVLRWQRGILFFGLSFSLMIGIMGAGYVSKQFQYLSSPEEMQAFQWIRKHLPNDRVVLHFSYGALLAYHSRSEVYELPADFLEGMVRDVSLGKTIPCQIDTDVRRDIRSLEDTLARLSQHLSQVEARHMLADSLPGVALQARVLRLIDDRQFLEDMADNLDSICQRPLYVYVSYSDEKNPFRVRDYDTGFSFETEHDTVETLSRYPDIFKPVYQNKRAFLWQVNSNNRK
jgi:hypothetical protein